MIALVLSGGPHGGETGEFASATPGTTLDLPSVKPGRVERYEVRVAVDGLGEEIDGEVMAIFTGTVRVP
jgi:hypothetical protein